jgi:uncharacterized protein YndB with AHSA1/START domain
MTELETTITIDAPAEDVWTALTTPRAIKEWFFGVDTETDWIPGNPLVHRGEWHGKPYEDKGTIIRFEPATLLIHTHWSPLSGAPDEPANYQEVRWSLEGRDDGTHLTINETNLPSEEARETSAKAWDTALGRLKDVVETLRERTLT